LHNQLKQDNICPLFRRRRK